MDRDGIMGHCYYFVDYVAHVCSSIFDILMNEKYALLSISVVQLGLIFRSLKTERASTI